MYKLIFIVSIPFAPVEGSITRLMALFENYGKLKKIGSVRSCRLYYCYFALEWDAIYCHTGICNTVRLSDYTQTKVYLQDIQV